MFPNFYYNFIAISRNDQKYMISSHIFILSYVIDIIMRIKFCILNYYKLFKIIIYFDSVSNMYTSIKICFITISNLKEMKFYKRNFSIFITG